MAENLYINGHISYPRTDNTVYPNSLDLQQVTKVLGNVSGLVQASADVLGQEKISATRGKNATTTDHPPVYPTSAAGKGPAFLKMNGNYMSLYAEGFYAPCFRLQLLKVLPQILISVERFL